ncbi:helix-turn-helix domain-containing protein [uncultured Microbacterium sp.]|uniref:AraC-like ligand-binding domain-containing protein n=1 Tax=uncultured Microbacterium sp. TaxID=191216 RepID=UPI0035CB1F4F
MDAVAPAPYLTEITGAGALQWRNAVSRLLVDIEMSSVDAPAFEGHLRLRAVWGLRFADVTASPSRSRSVRRAEIDRPAYILCYQLTGTGTVSQDSRSAELHPGELTLYATDRHAELEFGPDFRALSLRVPVDLVDVPRSRIDPLLARVLPSDGLAPVMGGYLERAGALLDAGSPASRLQAARTSVELFTTFVRSSLEDAGSDATGTLSAIRIVEYIDANLGDHELAPATIAAALHISVRQLYKLFTADDTVATYIRRRRLAMCERDLADPARAAEPIATIARRWGFESASHFGQLFREHSGFSPAAYRRDLFQVQRAA